MGPTRAFGAPCGEAIYLNVLISNNTKSLIFAENKAPPVVIMDSMIKVPTLKAREPNMVSIVCDASGFISHT